jgi:iron complex outermembrane receptor protein
MINQSASAQRRDALNSTIHGALAPKRNPVSSAVRIALVTGALTALTGLSVQAQNPPAQGQPDDVVIVTGSILRRTAAESPSPVSVLSSEALEFRGINTIAEAVQRLPANNAGTIQTGWNAGFNFASGANAPALRGLTVQATLSLADGLRMAPYPLADDGQRNFVDLNTIPSAIVERVEVLRDGASSTYGADAIAGVVNVITKSEIQGLHIGGSTAVAEQGGADEDRLDVTWGYGDLESQGFNFYLSGEYQNQEALWARDREYPFNTQDWSRMCGSTGSCMHNLNWNGVTAEDGFFNGLISIPGVALSRAVAAGANIGAGRYELLNPAAGCRQWPMITITPAQSGTSPLNTCEVNFQNAFYMLQPDIRRSGLSGRFTADVSDDVRIFAMANYYRTETLASFTPIGFNGSLPPPTPPGLAAANVILPVYVCANGVGTFNGLNTGCDATNGTLNPNNPYANLGQRAQVLLRSPNGRTVETDTRAWRAVVGLEGDFGNDDSWSYTANVTASEVGLTRNQANYMIPQRIWDSAARGTFNFADPYATSAETWAYIAPTASEYSPSRLWELDATIGKELADLGGGPLAVAFGAAFRNESITAPSSNPGSTRDSTPYTRYYSVNAVGTAGERDVTSAYFELSAPFFEQLEILASGRYDDYSTGQSNFSPKFGFKVTPIEMIAFRGTWSEGFRIPSFNEAFGLPTTGYVSRQVNCTTYAAFCAAHGNNAYASAPYNLGLTQTGDPTLNPEESESFTFGIVFEPLQAVSFTIDYWNIEVDGLISGVTSTGPVEAAYYGNNGVVNIPGFNVIPGVPDPAFPNALPVLGFIETEYANQDREEVSGIDFGVNFSIPMGDTVRLNSYLDISRLDSYELTTDSGSVLKYNGTLSPCNVTSCSGAPETRASWQNTLEFGMTAVTLTAYYTSGYDTASIDFEGIEGDCLGNAANGVSTASYVDGTPVNCTQDSAMNVDLTIRHQFNERYTLYGDFLNVLDIEPDFDPSAAYALYGYNPAWQGPNMVGRYFRVGFKAEL